MKKIIKKIRSKMRMKKFHFFNRTNHYYQDQCSEVFTYVQSCKYKKRVFDIYLDDYGQCYELVFMNNKDKVEEWCCGTYNDYLNEIEDIGDYLERK